MTKILLVDPDNYFREYLAMEFRQAGYGVVTKDTGQGLLEAIETVQPNLVVLDTELESQKGLDLLLDIRNKHYDLPVIMLSAQDQYRRDPRTLAADYIVSKSFDPLELKSKVAMAMEAHESIPQPSFCQAAFLDGRALAAVPVTKL